MRLYEIREARCVEYDDSTILDPSLYQEVIDSLTVLVRPTPQNHHLKVVEGLQHKLYSFGVETVCSG